MSDSDAIEQKLEETTAETENLKLSKAENSKTTLNAWKSYLFYILK